MTFKRTRLLLVVLLTVLTWTSLGCDTGAIGIAARSSFASFLSSISTTAINEAVGP